MNNKETIINYINENCIYFPKYPMLGKLPGTRYHSQFYLAGALYDPEILASIGEEFISLMDEYLPDGKFQIMGQSWSAIPLLSFLPYVYYQKKEKKINSFLLRDTRKTYGKNNYIEGQVNDLPVLIVNDLGNSTGAIRNCNIYCKHNKIELSPYAFTILNKYSTKELNYEYDRYSPHTRLLSIVNRDDLNVKR